MSCLYILDINPSLVISFSNIFSHSVSCLFILSVVSFAVQKLLHLIRSHLFIFAFVSFALGHRSKKILLQFMSKNVLHMFSSRSFMVFSLTFRFLIHFEFIFVYGVRKCSNFIILHVAVQFSQHHLLKRLSFPHLYSCLLCHRLIDHNYVSLLLGSLFCSIDLCVCFCASTILFWLL